MLSIFHISDSKREEVSQIIFLGLMAAVMAASFIILTVGYLSMCSSWWNIKLTGSY